MDSSRFSSLDPSGNLTTTPNSFSSMINPNSSAEMFQSNRLPTYDLSNPMIHSFSSSRSYDSSNSQYNHVDGFNMTNGEPMKKKRGRPRKYGTNGATALALTPLSSAYPNNTQSFDSPNNPNKRSRGRPLGSGKKQQLKALGLTGIGFTPHVIIIEAGEDVVSKIMAFTQQGSRSVCILSANGAVRNVTLLQLTKTYSGTVTYEGIFEIISLSGSFLFMDNGGNGSRISDMSVSLAGSDGRVLGGEVAGMLIAATPVQVIVGSFIIEKKKSKSILEQEPSSAPLPHMMMGLGTPVAAGSSPSQATSSESLKEAASPHSRASGACNNSAQSIQGTSTYSSFGWPHSAYPTQT